jgi:hypothetical protein
VDSENINLKIGHMHGRVFYQLFSKTDSNS